MWTSLCLSLLKTCHTLSVQHYSNHTLGFYSIVALHMFSEHEQGLDSVLIVLLPVLSVQMCLLVKYTTSNVLSVLGLQHACFGTHAMMPVYGWCNAKRALLHPYS